MHDVRGIKGDPPPVGIPGAFVQINADQIFRTKYGLHCSLHPQYLFSSDYFIFSREKSQINGQLDLFHTNEVENVRNHHQIL